MRTDLRRRIQVLERQASQDETCPRIDPRLYGACLSAEEWTRVLAPLDPDPSVAFAMMVAEDVPAFIQVLGDGSPVAVPKSFPELVAAEHPGSHLWAARTAAYAIAFKGRTIFIGSDTAAEIHTALERMFDRPDASEAERELFVAAIGMHEGVTVSERQIITIEFIGANARL